VYVRNEKRASQLRAAIKKGPVALPGAINALTGKAIEQAGFEGMYLSGAVLANSVGGVPDIGVMTLSEARQHAASVANVTAIPIVMDADTGFGASAECVARTVHELESAGVSGIHLEDQEFPKRCGHLAGKTLVPVEEFCEKLQAAKQAKGDPDFLLIARTDARGVSGYDDAVERAHKYLAAGADAIFPEALQGRDEFARFAQDVPTILLANMTEFGKTPFLTVSEFGEIGYDLVIFPVTLQRVLMHSAIEVLKEIKRSGTQKAFVDQMQTRQELYDMLGYEVAGPDPGTAAEGEAQ
jgi:methylisocitrate lyase